MDDITTAAPITENAAAAAAEQLIAPRLTPRQVDTIASALACGKAMAAGEQITPYNIGDRGPEGLSDEELGAAFGWIDYARKLGALAALVLDGRGVLHLTEGPMPQVRVTLLDDASGILERRRDEQPPRSALIH